MASREQNDGHDFATGLGWFSIGLGLAEVLAPSAVARFVGLGDTTVNRGVLRAIGARELATGFGILTRARPASWMRARVAGDMMDLALLGAAFQADDARRGRVTAATAAVLGVAALDVVCSQRLSRATSPVVESKRDGRIRVTRVITIRRSPDEVYGFWRDFANLPRFMYHLHSVQTHDSLRSHWIARAPAGTSVEWDAEVTDDRPNERIAWRSLPEADVPNAGVVQFKSAPRGRGTEVLVELWYDPPAGKLGKIVATLFGEEPGRQVGDDLHRLKQVLETGEVVRSDSTLVGQGWGYLSQRPAQPAQRQDAVATEAEAGIR